MKYVKIVSLGMEVALTRGKRAVLGLTQDEDSM